MKRPLLLLAVWVLVASFGFAPTMPVAQAQNPTPVAPACHGNSAGALATGISQHTLESGGMTREYLVYVPASYDAAQPVPLVISLHGFASSDAQQVLWTQWNAVADAHGFLVVYPQGTGSPARWNSGQTALSPSDARRAQQDSANNPLATLLEGFFEDVPVDDVAFIASLIDQLETDYCVDPARIYVNGLSNGGGMTNRLACQLSDTIAAIGTVAGAYTDFPGGCHPSRPMPVIAFHGVTDPIVPYEGNPDIHFPAIQTWAADWAARDQCDPTPQTIDGTVGAVTGVRYTGCADDAEVILYSIADGGHTWPGGVAIPFFVGKTSQDIDASATMWDFFTVHPLDAVVGAFN